MTIGALPMMAGDYPYLTFELTDGAKVSVPVSSLTLSINDTTLKAGSQSFTISNLTDETTNGATAIEELTADDLEGKEIYDLNGHRLASDAQLPRGVYIVKSKNKTCKIVVR